jgi:AcrR family transcriptional regulator
MTVASEVRPPAPSTRQRRKQARPQELLDAALGLFVEKGYAATRAEEVAARAGVSKGTLYLYYPSKEDLLKAVVRHNVVNQIAEGADFIRQFAGTTSELLATVLRLWWERMGDTPAAGVVKLMLSEARNFPDIAQFYVDEVIEPSHAMLAQMLRRGIERGEFRPVDVTEVVHVLVAPLLFLVMNKHSLGACALEGMPDPKRLIEAQIDLALHGLAPPRPRARPPAASGVRPAAAPRKPARAGAAAVHERPARSRS